MSKKGSTFALALFRVLSVVFKHPWPLKDHTDCRSDLWAMPETSLIHTPGAVLKAILEQIEQ